AAASHYQRSGVPVPLGRGTDPLGPVTTSGAKVRFPQLRDEPCVDLAGLPLAGAPRHKLLGSTATSSVSPMARLRCAGNDLPGGPARRSTAPVVGSPASCS